MKTFALALVLAAGLGSCLVSCLDEETVINIRAQIRQMIIDEPVEKNRSANDLAMIGGLVRLSFHDCVGGCDGCINPDNPENAGLQVYINRTDQLFNSLEVNGQAIEMSRADFWALAGIEAATFAAEKAGGSNPNIIFYTGREDCATSPTTDEMLFLPTALGDNEHIMDFFKNEFDFDEKEGTAILGAHTLGKAHRQASGFVHPWVPRKERLDNDFYSHLRDPAKGWAQRSIGRNENQKFFWETSGEPKQLMLNADMSLIRNLSSKDEKGQVSCDYSTCPIVNSASIDWVNRFADNNSLWVEEFGKAFQKMIENEWEGVLMPLVQTTTTSASTTTTAPLPDTVSTCSNNYLINSAMASKSGYQRARGRRLLVIDYPASPFPGAKMFRLKCRQRFYGFFHKKRFRRRERVKSFVASLWSRLNVANSALAKVDHYSLRVDIELFNRAKHSIFKHFEPNSNEWQRSVVEFSTEEDDIKFVRVWAVCAADGVIAWFDEMGLLANPSTCIPKA